MTGDRTDEVSKRLDMVISGQHKQDLLHTEVLGEIKLVKQAMNNLEMSNALQMQAVNKSISTIEEKLKKHDEEIEDIGRMINKAAGALVIVSILVGGIVSYIVNLITGLTK